MSPTFERAKVGVWTNAEKNANPNCPRCHGTGTYMYDHNHTTICPDCCKHNMGFWQLGEHHSKPGKWCCSAGCGKSWETKPDD